MSTDASRALVREYFDKMRSGDPGLPDLLTDDVEWWVPPGSRMQGTARGKPEVLELLSSGLDLYAPDVPLQVSIERIVAEGDHVAAQLVIEGRTARGADYRNHYHFAFEIRDGRIARVKEYVDTAYANAMLMPDDHQPG